MPLVILLILTILISGFIFGQPYYQLWQRQRIRARPFPEPWRQILKKRLPYYRALPTDLQLQLKKHIQVFIAEKDFVGCAGLTVTDEMRVTIAAQACLLLLNRPNHYFPQLRSILIYPAAFIVANAQQDAAGLVSEQRRILSGESWQQGRVILSWQDTLAGAANPKDGHNVVIHEFAHQLDQEHGNAQGAPLLQRSRDYQQWSQVMQQAFDQLRWQLQQGQPVLIDPYAATNPAEFFAVLSEVFFEQAAELAQQHPALYQQLSYFYRLDPLSWH
ncbi:M90 family metallopeptidase [Alishewanella sp. HL-SH06]|uniref:M90 family metallopeptidase n=1 Tax=Alishewanella sp. HL-SH06 TaxID=3461144 RepID=UPI0040416053